MRSKFKIILTLLLFIFITKATSYKSVVQAQSILYCGNTDIVWEDYAMSAGGASSDDLYAQAITTNLITSGSLFTCGTFPGTCEKCMAHLAIQNLEDTELDISCEFLPNEEEQCAGLGIMGNTQDYDERGFKGRGLLGLVNSLENDINDPLPLSFAYFMKQNAQKVPLLNKTAYAQTGGQYSGPMVTTIFRYWTITRNIAYALMAIIMLIIGIMIITQRKLDAKSALTVQQAIPQVIISIILIYISYPLGATGASLAYGLLNSSAAWAVTIFELEDTTVTEVTASIAFTSFASLGAQLISDMFVFISQVALVVYHIIILIKIFGIYLRLLLNIIASPLIFAVGAIPGQQKNIIKWFKQFGSNIISIPITLLAFELVKQLSLSLAQTFFANPGTFAYDYAGALLGTFVTILLPAFSIMALGVVAKIPNEIDKIVLNKGKQKEV